MRQDDCYARAAHLRATLSSLSLPPSPSLSPSSQWRAHAIFDESRGHVGFSLSCVSTTNFKRSRANQKERKLKNRGMEFSFFFFSISAFRSNRSEITTRKIVKGKKTRVSRVKFASFAIVSRRARTFSTIVIRCLLYVFPRVFPALTKFRDSQAK